MFKNKVDTYLRRAGYTWMKHVGLSISQWLPCPLAIWAFVLVLLNLGKSKSDGGNSKYMGLRPDCSRRVDEAGQESSIVLHKLFRCSLSWHMVSVARSNERSIARVNRPEARLALRPVLSIMFHRPDHGKCPILTNQGWYYRLSSLLDVE